jgi:hypothetical protein
MQRISIALLLAVLLLVPRSAKAQLIGVASSNTVPGVIYSINQANGAATLLTATPGTTPFFSGAEFRQGVLFVSNVTTGSNTLFGTYNLATGAFTQISNQTNGEFNDLWGLAYRPSNDRFYSVDGSSPGFLLVTIHPITGAISTIGPTGDSANRALGMAFDQANDILYALTSDFGGDPINLVTINPLTGAITTIGPTGQTATDARAGLAFDEDNRTLFMNLGTTTSAPNSLFSVNTATGAATLVGSNGPVIGNGIEGLAWRPVNVAAAAPEPAAIALVGMGLLPVAGAVIHRRRKS